MSNKEIVTFIDGDTLLWNIAWNLQSKTEEEANIEIDNYVNLILRNTKCDYYLGFLGESKTFRHKLYSEYKKNRPDKPEWFTKWESYIKNRLIEFWKFNLSGELEAEDCVSICANWYQESMYVVVAHIDKDLNQVCGDTITHYNFNTHSFWESNKFGYLALEQRNNKKKLVGTGLCWLYAQICLGDKIDNIPNLKKGYGEVKVYNLLKDCKTEMQLLKTVYKEFLLYSNKEAFILNRHLVKMLNCHESFIIPELIPMKKVEINIFEL